MSKKTVSFEEREINILSRYFTIDKAKKSRTINLYFDFSEDLLENSHQKEENRFFSPDVRSEIQNDLAKRPSTYRADIVLRVKDYGNRPPETLNNKLNDSFSRMGYSHQSSRKNTWFAATRLILFGLATLYLRYFLQTQGILNDQTTNREIIKEIRDTTATVFIWEAVSILLVTPSEDTLVNVSSIRKIKSISFADQEGNILLVYSSGKAKGKYRPLASFKKGARIGLLVAGGGLWGMGFTMLLSRISVLLHPDALKPLFSSDRDAKVLFLIFTIFSIVFILSCFFAGIGAFNLYNHSSRFRTLAIIGDIVVALVFAFGLYAGIMTKDSKLVIQCGFTFFFLIVSVLSSLLQRQKRTNIMDTSLVVKLETAQSKRQDDIEKRVTEIQKRQKQEAKEEKKHHRK